MEEQSYKHLDDYLDEYFLKCFYALEGNKTQLSKKLKLNIRGVRYICRQKNLVFNFVTDLNKSELSRDDIVDMETMKRDYFIKCYIELNGDRKQVASLLGMKPRRVSQYCQNYDLNKISAKKKEEEDDIRIKKSDYNYYDVTPEERDNWYNKDYF